MSIRRLTDISQIVYINLASRTDRKEQVEQELAKMGWTGTRFNAIATEHGAVGCSMSHWKVLKEATERHADHLLVVEDDIVFLDPSALKHSLDQFLQRRSPTDWDVVLLGGNNASSPIAVDETCVKIRHCQTTTGYLVNGHYLATLMDNVKRGVEQLIKTPTDKPRFAIDRFWFALQEVDRWFLLLPLTVVQREGYSDIEKRVTNYQGLMQQLYKTRTLNQLPKD